MHEFTLTPRASETDFQGHINNTAIPVWLDHVRYELMKIIRGKLSREDWPFAVARLEFDFKQQIFLDATVTIRSGLGRVGNSSIQAWHEIWQNDVLAVTSKSVMVCWDKERNCSRPLPEQILANIEAFKENERP